MENEALYLWSETIPNWVMALSAASAAVIFVWRRQDRLESQARTHAEIESGISAAWVKTEISGEAGEKWGVLITNSLPAAISSIEIACTGNNGTDKLRHKHLQPGKHFFESLGATHDFPWSLPKTNIGSHDFITVSSRHAVSSVSFTYKGTQFTTTA